MTGIEIAEREIRLVKWPNEQERPAPQILVRETLSRIFELVNETEPG